MPTIYPNVSVEVDVRVDLEIWCDACRNGLCNTVTIDKNKNGEFDIRVPPCENCLEIARKNGYDDGYDDGVRDAEREV